MAFCNSCGSAMEAGARFCPKCGAASGAAPEATPGVAPAAPASGGGALKIILIVLAVIVGLAILSMGTCAFMFHHALHHMRVHERDGNVHVDTPFGSVDTTQDSNEAAQNIGVEIYPGATVLKDGSANVNIGGMHTATVVLESDDSPSVVDDFYKSKLPDATSTSSADGRYSLMAGTKDNLTTINIGPHNGKTQIHIAKITRKIAETSN